MATVKDIIVLNWLRFSVKSLNSKVKDVHFRVNDLVWRLTFMLLNPLLTRENTRVRREMNYTNDIEQIVVFFFWFLFAIFFLHNWPCFIFGVFWFCFFFFCRFFKSQVLLFFFLKADFSYLNFFFQYFLLFLKFIIF